MNLYLISVDDWDYEEIDAIVAAAEDEEKAIDIWGTISERQHSKIRIIAKNTSEEYGIVLSSFNAG